jgi:hypothetical protein
MAIKRKKSRHKKKLRTSLRNTLFIVFGFCIIFSIGKIIANSVLAKSEEIEKVIYKSTSTFKQENQVSLKKNKYMNVKDIQDKQSFVTDLIDNIETKINYKYEGDTAKKINVTYKIKGILKSNYSSNGKEEEFWNKEYILLNEKEKSTNEKYIEINEKIDIDINEFDELVTDFIEEMQLAISSKLYVVFEANITAFVDEEMIVQNYSNEMEISLGEKITKITGNFNDKKEENETRKVKATKPINIIENIGWLTLAIASVYTVINLQKKTKNKNRVTNIYKLELNQILSACGDKIIKVDSNNSIYGENIIELSDINELFKLSEEAFKPILYYQVPDKQEAWFYVVLEKEIYRYILK